MTKNENKAPLMYKGWIIKKDINGKYFAENLANNIHLQPLYNKWEQLKLVIDAIK